MGKNIEFDAVMLTDERIINLYWDRDEQAIDETDKKYGRFLYRIAYNILYDGNECEECQNDTYLGAWNAIPPTRPVVLQAFLTQIMRRIAINRYKEKNRQKRVPSELTVSMEELLDMPMSSESIEETYMAKEVGKIISDYIRSLSDKRQYIFMGRYYCADSVESIAKTLSLTESSVYKELTKIKRELRAHLERNGICL